VNGISGEQTRPRARGRPLIAAALIFCVALVAFWEIMATLSRRPWEPFLLTAGDFAGFEPRSADWSVRPLPVRASQTEPNILAFEFRPAPSLSRPLAAGLTHAQTQALSRVLAPILVRLVHGYNMPDCMKLKGYDVELVEDTRNTEAQGHGQVSPSPLAPGRSLPLQTWRLLSSTGEETVAATAMIRRGDFSAADTDIRSMPFPRIDFPIGQDFELRGLSPESLRHPIRNFRTFMQARWNGARCDLMTFLGLRQPAWADREMLTLVAFMTLGEGDEEKTGVAEVKAAVEFMLAELQAWRAARAERLPHLQPGATRRDVGA